MRVLLLLLVFHFSVTSSLVVPSYLLDPNFQCVSITSDVCSELVPELSVGASVYMNGSVPESVIVQALADQLERFEQLRALDATCTTAIQRFFCLRFLPPCHSYESQSAAGTVDLPIGACYNSCLDMRSICNSTFTNLNITLPTCPPQEIIYDFSYEGGGNYTSNCTSFDSTGGAAICPLSVYFYGDKKPERLRIVVIVFGYVSFIECILVIILYGLNPNLRRWPGGLIIVIAVAETFMALSCMMQSWISIYDMHCSTNVHHRNLCKAQGFFDVTSLHFKITTWLLLTALTTYFIWAPNPAAAFRKTFKYRYYFLGVFIVPVAFVIYCCIYLGDTTSFALFCSVNDVFVQERSMVWPLLVQVAIGTLLWIASLIGTAYTLGFGATKNGNISIYVRLLLYEFIAIGPSSLFVLPYEIWRDEILGYTPIRDFIQSGRLWDLIILTSIASCISPFIFSTIFLARAEHIALIKDLFKGVLPQSDASTTASKPTTDGMEMKESAPSLF